MALFAAVHRSMELGGVKFDSATPEAAATPRTEAFSFLDYIGPVCDPRSQQPVHVPGDRELRFAGWAVDSEKLCAAEGVDVVIDEVVHATTYGSYRRDIATHFGKEECLNSGFTLVLAPGTLSKGEHVVSLRVKSRYGTYSQSPGMKFTVD
jgi:hypothetical protein